MYRGLAIVKQDIGSLFVLKLFDRFNLNLTYLYNEDRQCWFVNEEDVFDLQFENGEPLAEKICTLN